MFKLLESAGGSLLERLVPKVDAFAQGCDYWWKSFDSCWQCGGGPCVAYCATGCGCTGEYECF
ncbi:hypothetical protein [Streptomyces sp. NPDC087512]|uniref:hypothetical protein n=1 Tax=unclassified Streptomyces TaxID=2593676 RepID=UPI0034236E16